LKFKLNLSDRDILVEERFDPFVKAVQVTEPFIAFVVPVNRGACREDFLLTPDVIIKILAMHEIPHCHRL
jgi:hypothetical protein